MSLKNEILRELTAQSEAVSGNELANRLGVSRSAVWKAVEQLRREGCRIAAAQNRGYRLLSSGERLSEAHIRAELTAQALGCRIEIHPELSSTNDRAKALALSGAPHGTVVIAQRQSGGKGRKGRSFFSPDGGIYMSVLLRPQVSIETAGLITSCAAVAVANAIEALGGPEIGIKWVNDLFAKGKKLCGILTEGAANLESGSMEYVVLGIGINVGCCSFPDELCDTATSIYQACGVQMDRSCLIAEVLNQLESALPSLESRQFIAESRRRSILLGKAVRVFSGNRQFDAVAVDLNENGQLIVEADGVLLPLSSGEVSVRAQ